VLLAGAALVAFLFVLLDVPFYWVPAVVGGIYLVAAVTSGSRGRFWGPGLLLGAVGVTSGLWFHDGRGIDFEYLALTVLSLGTGAVVAALLERARIRVGAMGIALPLLLFGAYALAEQQRTQHVAGNGWLVAGFLAAWGLLELRA
jgi:hypothetical protein